MDKTKVQSLFIAASTNIKQAMQQLTKTAERILFVTGEDGRLIGTVNDGDIRRGIINGIQLNSPVQKIMRTKFISIDENCSDLKKRAKKLMHKHHIQQIPVINVGGLITNVVSWHDCLGSENECKDVTATLFENPVVIMAGGKGTRLDPFTKILPKPLIPLGNKPIIEHIMDRYYKNGFYKFILMINHKKELIKLYFSENRQLYNIEYIEEKDYYGTAGGLFLLKEKIEDTFIVGNCDTILEGCYKDFFKWHKKRQNILTIVGSHKEITVPYGVLYMNNGSLINMDEKPKLDMFINTGTYIFEPDVLKFIDDFENINMDRLINKIQAVHQDGVGVYPHWGGWFDLGQWDEYKKSVRHFGEKINDL